MPQINHLPFFYWQYMQTYAFGYKKTPAATCGKRLKILVQIFVFMAKGVRN